MNNLLAPTPILPGYKNNFHSILERKPPATQEELTARLDELLGKSIAELSILAKVDLPYNNLSGKGFCGQLIELFLGADAGNKAIADFTGLGIELKTLPVGFDLKPQESTFVCTCDLAPQMFIPFEKSALYHKMNHMLFVMLLCYRGMPLADRRVIAYFYVKLNDKELETLKTDYNEFSEMILQGRAHEINASYGTIVQMRPKAASSKDLVPIRDSEGNVTMTRPRGFYIRTSFTKSLCERFLQEQGISAQDFDKLKQLQDVLITDDDDDEVSESSDEDIPYL